MKKLVLVMIFLFVEFNFINGQSFYNSLYVNQDSIFLKEIDKSLLEIPDTNLLLEDSIPFFYHFSVENHKIALKIFDSDSQNLIDSHIEEKTWWIDTSDIYYIVNKSHKIIAGRTFVNIGLQTTHVEDTNTNEQNTYSSFYSFLIDDKFSVSLFDFIPEKTHQLMNDYYAFGNSFFWSGGGFTWDCSYYSMYQYNDSEIEIINTYPNCEGYPITFIDSVFNNHSHVFCYVHPDLRTIEHLYGVSFGLDLQWQIDYPPYISSKSSSSISINSRNNYLISMGGYYNDPGLYTELIGPYFFIFDLESGDIIDTLCQNIYETDFYDENDIIFNIESGFDKNNTLYFKHTESNESKFYIIDQLRNYTKNIQLNDNTQIGDTIGKILCSNVLGSNLSFESHNDYFNIDLKTGVITLLKNYEEIDTSIYNLTCIISDTFNKDTINIVVSKPLSLSENKFEFEIYPNPTHGELNINCPFKNVDLLIYNIHGKLILKQSAGLSTSVNLEKLSYGIYFLKIKTDLSTEIRKIIIN